MANRTKNFLILISCVFLVVPPVFGDGLSDFFSGGKWFIQLQGGGRFPVSDDAAVRFNAGPHIEGGIGYVFSDGFTLGLESGTGWLNYSAQPFINQVQQQYAVTGATAETGNVYLTHTPLEIFGQYSFLTNSSFAPYVFLGAGVAFDVAHGGSVEVDHQGTAWLFDIPSDRWINLELDPGFGVVLAISDLTKIFLQGKLEMDFAPTTGSHVESSDSPLIMIPVQAGVKFIL